MRALALLLVLPWDALAGSLSVPRAVRLARPVAIARPLRTLARPAPASFPRALPLPELRALPVAVAPAFRPARVSGRELLGHVQRLAARGQRVRDYDDAKRYMFGVADNIERDGARGIMEAYSQIFVPGSGDHGGDYPERGDQNGDGWVDAAGMNVEHLWPQSFFAKRLPMRSDLHHLLPTFMKPNSVRDDLPFGEVRGRGEYENSAGAKVGQGVFEPPNAVKGRIARAMFYFYALYHEKNITGADFDDSFWNGKIEMFLRWNRTYPPDAQERARNALVQAFQGNRNPFIDDPSLADRIGVEGFRRSGRWGLGYGDRRSRGY